MIVLTDTDLYLRGAETLLASWEEYARGATGAAVQHSAGVATAVFPNEPERAVYNNALLERDLSAAERADALDAMEAAYAAVGVKRFAAWVHESDEAMRTDLELRGYTIDESTRAMGMALDGIRLPKPEIELGPPDWFEYLRIIGVPTGFLNGADHAAFHVLVARLDGENVATAMAFDLGSDCGIYNVTTLEHARRRGLGTALTALLVLDALARGCQTASLQSTAMAERVYAAVGFRDLGRILEYVPSGRNGVGPGSDTVDTLILDLLEWMGPNPRPYTEVLEAWQTSCPRLPVWEEATDRGFIARHRSPGREALVSVSVAGVKHLRMHRPPPPG